MTWTAPSVERVDAPHVAGEPEMLEAWLDYHRATLLHKCAGLTGEQLCERSAEPSTMSLLGLVRHMTEVENGWFRHRVGGEPDLPRYCGPGNWDGEFDDVEPGGAEHDYATYLADVEACRAVVAGRSLDETFFHSHRKAEIDVRWVYVHMIEEYARHNGHADLLRERIDGVTGD